MYICTKYSIFYLIIQYINSLHGLNSTKYLLFDSFTWEVVFMKSKDIKHMQALSLYEINGNKHMQALYTQPSCFTLWVNITQNIYICTIYIYMYMVNFLKKKICILSLINKCAFVCVIKLDTCILQE